MKNLVLFSIFSVFGLFQNVLAQFGGSNIFSMVHPYDAYQYADFNADNLIDVICINTMTSPDDKVRVELRLQESDGEFLTCSLVLSRNWPLYESVFMSLIDFDDDGLMDFGLKGKQGMALYRNLGQGQFELKYENQYETLGGWFFCYNNMLIREDFNEDGFFDLLQGIDGGLAVYQGTSDPWIFEPQELIELGMAYYYLYDCNLDGRVDAYGGDVEGNTVYRRNDGLGQMILDSNPIQPPLNGLAFETIHIDSDNLRDYIELNIFDGELLYGRNLGYGNYEVSIIDNVSESSSIELVDVDMDQDIDIVLYGIQSTIYYNDNGEFTTGPFPFYIGYFLELDFVDFDSDGNIDIFLPWMEFGSEDSGVYIQNGNSMTWQFSSDLPIIENLFEHSWGIFATQNAMNLTTMEGDRYVMEEWADGYCTRYSRIPFSSFIVNQASRYCDLDYDGDFDFVAVEMNPTSFDLRFTLYLNENGVFVESVIANSGSFMLESSWQSNPFLDQNSDGIIDIVLIENGDLVAYINDGAANFSSELIYDSTSNLTDYSIGLDGRIVSKGDGPENPVESYYAVYQDDQSNWVEVVFENLLWPNIVMSFLNDYNGDGLLDLMYTSNFGVLLYSNILNDPQVILDIPFGNDFVEGVWTRPFIFNNEWHSVVLNGETTYLEVVNLSNNEVILQVPGDYMAVAYLTDIDVDGDLDLLYRYDAYSDIKWCQSVVNDDQSIDITVFNDGNLNGLMDDAEQNVDVGNLEIFVDGEFVLTNSGNGIYSLELATANCNIDYNAPSNIWQMTTDDYVSIYNGNASDEIFIGIAPIGQFYDCYSTSSLSNSNCNYESSLQINVVNTGNSPIECGALVLIDPIFSFISATVSPSINGNEYTFNCGLLEVGETMQIEVYLNNPSEQLMGDQYQFFSTGLTNQNGVWTQHESSDFNGIVACAYDPNDKTELNTLFTDHLYEIGQGLEYLVRFQNTGNAPATNIHIVDQLSSNLDRSTFQMLDASHDYYYSLSSTGELIVYFDNIMLADSFSNEVESHGYFKYSIQPIYSEEPGQTVYNTAYIYFDENPAVITNTTYNAIQIIGVEEYGFDRLGVSLYPNPNQGSFTIQTTERGPWDMAIYDLYGKLVQSESFSGETISIASEFAEGVYIVKLRHRASDEVLLTRFMCVK